MTTPIFARLVPALLLAIAGCAAYEHEDLVCESQDLVDVAHPAPITVTPPAYIAVTSPVTRLPLATELSFQSINYPDQFIHADHNFMGTISAVHDPDAEGDSTFRVVPGLSGAPGSISFESVRYPGSFLRHQGFAVKLHPRGTTDLYKNDASFIPRPGLGASDGLSFQSVNYPDHFLRHRGFRLYIDPLEKSELYRADTTFRPLTSEPGTGAQALAVR